MRLLRPLWLGRNPLVNGFWLAVLNGVIVATCVATFLGFFALIGLAENGSLTLPFPFPLLPFLFLLVLALYTAASLAAWGWFARRLPAASRGATFVATLLGVAPLLALAALGYANAFWQSIFGDFANDSMLDVRIFLTTLIATIIVVAGLTCVAVVTFLAPVSPARGPARP